jgi:hypothetical protein
VTVHTGPVFDWTSSGLDWRKPEWNRPSPNLVELTEHLGRVFGGRSLGIHFDRPQSSGSGKPSEHSWGAALDHGASTPGTPIGRHREMVDWVVDHSAELHICAIVDIGRSWKAGRGWIPYRSGYTHHAHFVTDYAGWFDNRPIATRSPRPVEPSTPWRDPMHFAKHPDHPELFAVGSVKHVTSAERDQLVALGVTDRIDTLDDNAYRVHRRAAGI